jgi:hypothetical protein
VTNNPTNLPPLKLSIEEDGASFSKVEQRTAQTFSRITNLAKANDAVAQSAQRMGRTLADAFAAGATKVDENTKSIQALRKEYQGLEADQKKASGGLKIEGLRRTGGALSQLGLGEVGGAVSRAGDVAQVVKEVGNFAEALGPLGLVLSGVAGAAVGLQVGLALLENQLKDSKQALQSALDSQKAYYDLLAAATTEDVERRKRELEKVAAVQQKAIAETEGALKSLEEQTKISRDVGIALPGVIGDPFRMLTKQLDENKKAAADTGAAIGRLEGGLKSNAFAANDAEKAIADYVSALDESVQKQIQFTKMDETATRQSLDARLKAIKTERDAIWDELAALQKQDQANASVIAKEKELEKALSDLAVEEAHLTTVTRQAVQARASERSNVRTDSPQLKELTESEDRQIAVVRRYNAEKERIDQQSLEARANIEKKYADKLVDIARQAADDRAAALRKSEQALADLLTSFVRDEEKAARDLAASQLEAQISAERDEAKAYRDHQHDLERIRKAAQDREFEMIQNRDFLGLFNSRRQTSRDIESSNDDFMRERNERRIALAQQLEDLKRNAARERQERLIAYQQQIVDARQAYQRDMTEIRRKHDQELALARQAHQRELSDLATANRNKLALLRNQTNREMAETRLVGDARIKYLEKERQWLISQAGSFGNPNQAAHHAGGGAMQAGDISWVNERRGQRERFNGVPFPPGLGLFQAAQSGTVSPGGSSAMQQTNTFYITSQDPQGVRREVLQVLHEVTR